MAVAAMAAKAAVEAERGSPTPPATPPATRRIFEPKPSGPFESVPTWVLVGGTAVLALVTAAAIASPFDGPVGDVAAGSATASIGSAAMARFGFASAAAAAGVVVFVAPDAKAETINGAFSPESSGYYNSETGECVVP